MGLIVDTNVLVDILSRDPAWMEWSLRQVGLALSRGAIAVNDIIYAEVSVRLDDRRRCDEFLVATGLRHAPMPPDALFLAGRAHQAYRRRGGTRTGVLSDFFIGAHAAIEGWAVLTRDTTRYRNYFPSVPLIAP